jgi:hypothetical protein
MNPRVSAVIANNDYTLILTFTNQETRRFDIKPYLHYPAFAPLNEVSFFMLAKVDHGTVVWPQNLDFDPDRLFIESTSLENSIIDSSLRSE